jgi:hypothetical protein
MAGLILALARPNRKGEQDEHYQTMRRVQQGI